MSLALECGMREGSARADNGSRAGTYECGKDNQIIIKPRDPVSLAPRDDRSQIPIMSTSTSIHHPYATLALCFFFLPPEKNDCGERLNISQYCILGKYLVMAR
jgi:hypothetical protein